MTIKLSQYPHSISTSLQPTINIDSGAEAAKFNNDTLPQARARMKQRWDKSLVETEKEDGRAKTSHCCS